MNEKIDYHFGWRYLLPLKKEEKVGFLGLTNEEFNWWKGFISKNLMFLSPNNPDGWIINLEKAGILKTEKFLLSPNTRWFSVYGRGWGVALLKRKLDRHFNLCEYALLPSKNSRVVVPLKPTSATFLGLNLHKPGRPMAKLLIELAKILLKIGLTFPLKRKVLLLGIRKGVQHNDIVDSLKPIQKWIKREIALYLGNPEENRKTIILPLHHVPPKIILKVAENQKARNSLKHEKDTLLFLSSTSIKEKLPSILGWEENKNISVLCLEYLQKKAVDKKIFYKEVFNFFSELALIKRQKVCFSEVFESIEKGLCKKKQNSIVRYIIEFIANSSYKPYLLINFTHGDFAPWNCCWTEKGLIVFDWEESGLDLALTDVFYYFFAPAIHISGRWNLKKLLFKTIKFAKELSSRIGIDERDVKLYFIFWILKRFDKNSAFCEKIFNVLRRYYHEL